MNMQKIGFGGGCHWCTEAVFDSLKGVIQVKQGYIRGHKENDYFSEAVLVYFDPKIILINDLIAIHLHTHNSTSDHSFRKKYRSAVYYHNESEHNLIKTILNGLQKDFKDQIITQPVLFQEFTSSRSQLLNYYSNNPEKPFCKKYIDPKLKLLKEKYSKITK
ncbi:peptide-methionine (S)-S-oxide reductase [Aquimarina aquimarini]|uniref:peptide-methionine (S)-S-oxide reductase n=1 Tax=Aquimarina aquimarini TaxID=1191734 RepID=UPI000D55A737|nr:peptide-methionine (S)-S-oxide reductase [Aquimarina aquimarini]